MQHIVEMHDGKIAVDSAGAGLGATFTVSIPRLDADGETRTDALNQAALDLQLAALPLAGLKILVVDDEVDAQELVQFLLEEYGAAVRVATSATEAIASAADVQPDLVVSDIGMPQIDGYEFISQVRKLSIAQGGQIPAIALTAYARDEDRCAALAAGFQAHVTKPIETGELVKTILQLRQM